MEIKWITWDVLAPNTNWLKQKENVLARKLRLLQERQASGLASLSSALCGFLLKLHTRPHTGTKQHPEEQQERQALPVALFIRRLLPEAPGKSILESHRLEENYWTTREIMHSYYILPAVLCGNTKMNFMWKLVIMSFPQEAEYILTWNGPIAFGKESRLPHDFQLLCPEWKSTQKLKTNCNGFCTELGCLSLVLETVKNCIMYLEGKVYIIYLGASINSLPKQSFFLWSQTY